MIPTNQLGSRGRSLNSQCGVRGGAQISLANHRFSSTFFEFLRISANYCDFSGTFLSTLFYPGDLPTKHHVADKRKSVVSSLGISSHELTEVFAEGTAVASSEKFLEKFLEKTFRKVTGGNFWKTYLRKLLEKLLENFPGKVTGEIFLEKLLETTPGKVTGENTWKNYWRKLLEKLLEKISGESSWKKFLE